MRTLKQTLKSVLPERLWLFLRGIHLRRRMSRTPKIGDFDSEAAIKRGLGTVDLEWRRRIDDVMASPDNDFIPRCENAGRIESGLITMHNGIRVGALSYYGSGMMNLLVRNKGVHEPQEERVFQDVLPTIASGSAMIELGAYWGFYSLWFAHSVPESRNILVEPILDNLEAGKFNFRANGKTAVFEQAFAGGEDGIRRDGERTVSVDGLLTRHQIPHLAILHIDVQGAEAEVLRGASGALSEGRIDYIFVSTHSNDLHRECRDLLAAGNFQVLVDVDLDGTYSDDGLLVARREGVAGPTTLAVSRKGDSQSLQAPANHAVSKL